MKFPRNTKILRSQFDAAPFAAVFFLLVMLLMLGAVMPTPGVRLALPVAAGLPGVDRPTVAVAVDAAGHFYFANQQVTNEVQLSNDLRHAVAGARQPLTLVVHADKAVTYEQLVRLTLLARDAGITNALLATLPGQPVAPATP